VWFVLGTMPVSKRFCLVRDVLPNTAGSAFDLRPMRAWSISSRDACRPLLEKSAFVPSFACLTFSRCVQRDAPLNIVGRLAIDGSLVPFLPNVVHRFCLTRLLR
jgi:hypothetical protein